MATTVTRRAGPQPIAPPSPQERRNLVDAALGRRPFDLIIRDVRLVNVFTGEIYPAFIGLSGRFIAYVGAEGGPAESDFPEAGSVIDGGGAFALPGFIDSHVHIESSMLTPPNFARMVIPLGTTTVITDPHEIGNVMGIRGVEYMLTAGRDLPMFQFALAPSCVPAVPELESSGASFGREEMARMLEMEGVLGMAEVMDYEGVLAHSPRMTELLDLAVERGVFIQGHFFGDDPRTIAAYLGGGPRSNHEFMGGDEALKALRAGMTVDARDSSFTRDISNIVGALKNLKALRNLTLCTDDRHPGEIRESGHMDDCLRSAVSAGLDPVEAVRAVSLNTATAYGLDRLGAVAPGYVANINLAEDLALFRAREVFFSGTLVATEGQLLAEVPARSFAVETENTVHLDGLTEAMLRIPAPAPAPASARGGEGSAKVRVIVDQSEETALTDLAVETVGVAGGHITLENQRDLNFIAIINRHRGNKSHAVGLIRNFHLARGAVAGTVCHDSHNLAVVYTNVADAMRAIRVLEKSGGGLSFADGEQVETLELPVAGLISRLDSDALIPEVERMNRVLAAAGIRAENPVMRLATVALPVIPSVKITDRGLVDTETQTFLDLFVG